MKKGEAPPALQLAVKTPAAEEIAQHLVVLIRDGYDTASSLSDELVRRSGLEQMLTSLEHNFAARADALKARHALSSVARLLALDESPSARSHEEAIRRELQQSHQFRETVLLSELRAFDRPELPVRTRPGRTDLGWPRGHDRAAPGSHHRRLRSPER